MAQRKAAGIVISVRRDFVGSPFRLGRWLGTSPEFWMNLQQIYTLRRAQEEHGAEIEQKVKLQSVA